MNLVKQLLIILTVCFGLFTSEGQAQTTLAAEIPHTYDVSPNGAFTYEIPLRIPPGIRGMMPNLAISYNSENSSNGFLGVGWTISGISMISRGVPTIFHNSNIAPIDFNGDDVFFLDGQRLFKKTTNSSYYLTEAKNFAEIIEYGSSGSGPSYFTVQYPNGTIYEYGNTPNSKMYAQGRQDVLMWSLNKISDLEGNFVEFDYESISSSGEYRLKSIIYGTNPQVTTTVSDASIQLIFNYKSRTDENQQWIGGSLITQNKLLDYIDVVFADGTYANKYSFTYNNDAYSHLVQIDEQRWNGSNAVNLPPVFINWGTGDHNVIKQSVSVSSGSGRDCVTGDFNGDGFTDYISMPIMASSGITYDAYINTKSNNFTLTATGGLPFTSGWVSSLINKKAVARRPHSFDYDGDGLDDVILIIYDQSTGFSSYGVYLLRANGSSTVFDAPQLLHFNMGNQNYTGCLHIIPGDYDGDGKNELIIMEPLTWTSASFNFVNTYQVRLVGYEHSTASTVPLVGLWTRHSATAMALDYNGDGKDEILRITDFVTLPFFQNEVISFNFSYNSGGKPTFLSDNLIAVQGNGYPGAWDVMTLSGDFNGDANTDVLSCSGSTTSGVWRIGYSEASGSGYTCNIVPSPLNNLTPYYVTQTHPSGYYISDFNGDGKDDILQLDYNSSLLTNYKMFYSKGNNEFEYHTDIIAGIHHNYEQIRVGDFNGDGQADLFSYSTSTQPSIIYFSPNSTRDLVTSITHAGKSLSLTYKSLPQDPDYVNNTFAVYPDVSKPIPIKVVKVLTDGYDVTNTYTYKKLLLNNHGLGVRGFQEFTVANNSGQKNELIFNHSGPISYVARSKFYNPSNTSCPFGVERVNTATIDAGGGGKSLIMTIQSVETNYIKGTITSTVVNKGSTAPGSVFYDYGKPASTELHVTDLAGNPVKDVTTTFTYPSSATFINKGKPTSVTATSEIGGNGNVVSQTTNFIYNYLGQLQSKISNPLTGNEKTTSYYYDVVGNLEKTELTAAGVTSTITDKIRYTDCKRFVAETENTLHYVTRYDYGSSTSYSWGFPQSKTGVDGFSTYYEYDELNRITRVTDGPTGNETYTSYAWASASPHKTLQSKEMFAITNTNNVNSSYGCTIIDIYGRKIRTAKPSFDGADDIYEDYEYNQSGKQSKSHSPYPASNFSLSDATQYSYDEYNRLTQVTNTTSNMQYTYSYPGGVLKTIVTNVLNGDSKTYEYYDDLPKSVISNNGSVAYTYFGNGTPKTITTNGEVFTNTIDAFGRTTSKTEPNAGTTIFQYNGFDELTRITLNNLVSYDYTYDDLGRVIKKQEVSKQTYYTYVYDDVPGVATTGKLIYQEAPNGSNITSTYNSTFGSLAEVEENDGSTNTFVTQYTYDVHGRLDTRTYPYGDKIKYQYNGYGSLISLGMDVNSGSGTTPVAEWHVSDRNHLDQLTSGVYKDGNGNQVYDIARSYDQFGFLTTSKLSNVIGNSIPVVDVSYDFNTNTRNLNERTDNIRGINENFTYNVEFDRLTKVEYSGTGISLPDLNMSYDNLGNILKKSDVTASTYNWKYYHYALESIPEPQVVSLPFTPYEIPSFTQDVTYTPFMKVHKVREDTKNEVEITYGPDDERIRSVYKDIAGIPTNIKTKYYASNYEKIVDAVTNDEVHVSYVWADDELIAVFYHNNTANVHTVYFTQTDHLGSITHLFDNVGMGIKKGLIEERSFDAWGRVRDPDNFKPYYNQNFPAWIIDRGYTGHEHLWSIVNTNPAINYNNNIINMNGRLYDPLVGRMFSPDPYIPDGKNSQDYNKYIYARNNPLKYTDPDGNFVQVNNISIRNTQENVSTGQQLLSMGIMMLTSYVGGVVGGYIGNAVGSSVLGLTGNSAGALAGGATAGASCFASGFLGGAGNAWIGGANFGDGMMAGLKSGTYSAIGGAVFGGLSGGIRAMNNEQNFWTGKPNNLDQSKDGFFGMEVYRATPVGIQIEKHYSSSGNYSDVNWIQTVETNYLLPPQSSSPFLDCANACPTYNNPQETMDWKARGLRTGFHDEPQRDFAKPSYFWKAELSLVGRNGNGPWHRIKSFKYGYEYNVKSGIHMYPLQENVKESTLSSFHLSFIK